MRRILIAVIAALAFSAPLKAEPLKITVEQAWTIFNGLKALDGYQDKLKDGERVTSINVSYKFGPGLRWAVAKNEIALQAVVETYQKAARAQHAELDSTRSLDPNSDAGKSLAEADAKLASEITTVDLVRLKQAEFNLDKNEIPPSVLAAISAIVDP